MGSSVALRPASFPMQSPRELFVIHQEKIYGIDVVHQGSRRETFRKRRSPGGRQAAEADPNQAAAANQAASDAIVDYVRSMNLDAEGLSVKFDGAAAK